jgi:hypothetical protein
MQRSAAVALALLAACEDEVAQDCPGEPVATFHFTGQRAGDSYLLETSTDGAVLGDECAPTCSAKLRLVVAGDVLRVDGEAVSFAGVLVEVLSAVDGSACGTCTPPCAARYAITGTP